MKRYRGKDANYHRIGYGFPPQYKRGKRAKRQFAKDVERGKALLSPVHVLTFDEALWLAQIFGEPLPVQPVVSNGTVAYQWRMEPPFYPDAYEHKYA